MMKTIFAILVCMGISVSIFSQNHHQAYYGDDGAVLIKTVMVNRPDMKNITSDDQAPGWPVKIKSHPNLKPFAGVALADLDKDGADEILMAAWDKMYVFKGDGTLVWSQSILGVGIYPPAVADINQDGELEIVLNTGGSPNNGHLYVFDKEGNILPEWPVTFQKHWLMCAPALCDVNGDGMMEIIVGTRTSNNIHVLKLDGTEMDGWPVNIEGTPAVTATVADIDNDGMIDIVTASTSKFFAFNADGTLKEGFPIEKEGISYSYQSPLVVDLDNDQNLHIVGAAHGDNPEFFVRNHLGAYRDGWPKTIDSWTYSSPAVVDIAGNGDFHLFFGRYGASDVTSVVFGYLPDGTLLPNFPLTLLGGPSSNITIVDLDNDGVPELIFDSNIKDIGTELGYIEAFHLDGTIVEGFPKRPQGFTMSNSPSFGDVNGDGLLDMVAISYDQTFSPSDSIYINVYSFDTPIQENTILFGTYKGNVLRNGLITKREVTPPEPNCNAPHIKEIIIGAEPSLTVQWTEPEEGSSGNLLGYKIIRDEVLLNEALIQDTSYQDFAVEYGAEYCYQVVAVFDDECEAKEDEPTCENLPSSILDTSPNAISIYPNPATRHIIVSGENIQAISIYNTLGQLIITYSNHITKENYISTTALNAGMYIVKITTSDNHEHNKTVIVIK